MVLTRALHSFVAIEPFLGPILKSATGGLSSLSEEVINNPGASYHPNSLNITLIFIFISISMGTLSIRAICCKRYHVVLSLQFCGKPHESPNFAIGFRGSQRRRPDALFLIQRPLWFVCLLSSSNHFVLSFLTDVLV